MYVVSMMVSTCIVTSILVSLPSNPYVMKGGRWHKTIRYLGKNLHEKSSKFYPEDKQLAKPVRKTVIID